MNSIFNQDTNMCKSLDSKNLKYRNIAEAKFDFENEIIGDEEPELSIAKIMIALILVGAVVLFLNTVLERETLKMEAVEKSIQK